MSEPRSPGPLTGRTIVVTRSTDQASRLSELLIAEGAAVVEVPLIQVVDAEGGETALDAALAQLDRSDWLVVTSPNGARRVAARLGSGAVPGRVAAIGHGTAHALGRQPDLIPERQVAEGLLAEFPPGPGRVVLVQGDLARPVLADGLRDLGWDVIHVVAYRNEAVVPSPADRRAIAAADAVTLASGSAARSLMGATGGEGLPARVVSIGPVTTRAAGDVGMTVTVTATDHSLAGLVQAVVTAVGR